MDEGGKSQALVRWLMTIISAIPDCQLLICLDDHESPSQQGGLRRGKGGGEWVSNMAKRRRD